jgi:DNA-binding cell septation regulator SpoVG
MTTEAMEITEVRLRLRSPGAPGSLVGWASCVVNRTIKLDSIEIHRRRDGSLYLWCPTAGSRSGVAHRYFFPVTAQARQALEAAVLGALSTEARQR